MKQVIFLCLLAVVPAILSAAINDAEVNAKVVNVYLYTVAGDKTNKVTLTPSNAATAAGIVPGAELPVLIHGFMQSSACSFPQDIKDAYLNTGSPAVIVVDWRDHAAFGVSSGIAPLYYPSAVSSLQTVADTVSKILEAAISAGKTSQDQIHVVGVSLGAHCAGRVGDTIKRNTGKQVARVTGLDPAGPSFGDSLGNNRRIQPGDGKFVDAIHSDAGSLGTTKSCGDVDFWPNKGVDPQPGCEGQSDTQCSHGIAARIFMDSIFGTQYTAQSCNSWDTFQAGGCKDGPQTSIGMMSSVSAKGDYFAKTVVPMNWTGRYNCKD